MSAVTVNDVLARARAFLREARVPHAADAPAPGAGAVHKTIWASPAGKKRIAARLVQLIPAHKTYVEPFAGSGAVFFAKGPAQVEVLADADPEIAGAYRALARLTDHDLAALKRKDWTGRRKLYDSLKKATPTSDVDKLYRFLYLARFSYGKIRGTAYNAQDDGIHARTIARIERHRERLRSVKVRAAHYADVIKEFDGKDTFFFLDPPYPGYNVDIGESRFDELEFRKVLDHIKGKFLITYGTRGKLDTSGFHVKKIRTPRVIAPLIRERGPKTLTQLLIANYAITQKSLGPYPLDDDAGDLELTTERTVDLLHARALARALAKTASAPPLVALAAAFETLEPVEDDSALALARALSPLVDRLEPAVHTAPTFALALRAAQPALAALANLELDKRAPTAVTPIDAPAPAPHVDKRVLDKRIPLLKTEEERYVLGIVLEPEFVDSQNDIYSANEIRNAAHRFLESFQNVGLMHEGYVNNQVKIIESYLAPVDFDLAGQKIKKGTWLLALHILDDKLWDLIKSGELTGLSMGGSARREAVNEQGAAA